MHFFVVLSSHPQPTTTTGEVFGTLPFILLYEADFSVMFDDKETRMIELKSLAVFATCAFMNLENVAIGDVQLSLKSCRVDLISASLLLSFQGFPLL